jgi:DUF4097 and DUF4098 domain-containing protein YvlB
MRKLALTVLTLVLAASASAASLTQTIDKTFDVRPGATVSLSNVNGRVTIKSWDQPRVHVVAVKEVEADRDEVKRVLDDLRVELQPKDGGLVITTHHPKETEGFSGFFSWLTGDRVSAEVTYDITVPRTMNVEAANVNGGIVVSDVTGKHELETVNGKIEVSRCAGSLDASTTNGSIHAELTKVTKGQPLHFETTNGRIEVQVPKDLAVDVDAGTTNGSISSDLPVSTNRFEKNSLRGTINGGGTPLKMRTTNGGIAIRSIG